MRGNQTYPVSVIRLSILNYALKAAGSVIHKEFQPLGGSKTTNTVQTLGFNSPAPGEVNS